MEENKCNTMTQQQLNLLMGATIAAQKQLILEQQELMAKLESALGKNTTVEITNEIKRVGKTVEQSNVLFDKVTRIRDVEKDTLERWAN